MAAIGRYPVVIKADGLAAGKGVVIAADEARGARGARGDARRAALRRRDPVVVEELPRRRGAVAARAVRRRARGAAGARAATTSASATATPGPNTGGMGAYSPVPGIDAARATRSSRAVHQPVVDELARARHAVPRRPLRRADAHRRRPARCSSSTCASATRRRRRCCRGCARDLLDAAAGAPPSRAGSPASRSSGTTRCGGDRRARLAPATRRRVARATSSPGSTPCPTASRSPTPARRERRRARSSPPAAACSNVTALGRRRRGRPRRRLCCRRRDHLRRPPAAARHRRMRARGPHDERPRPRSRGRPETETEAESRSSRSTRRSSGSSWARRATWTTMEKAGEELDDARHPHEIRVMSAHRDPDDGRRLRQERADARPAR